MSRKQQKSTHKEIITEAVKEVKIETDLGKSYQKNDHSYLIIGLIIGLSISFVLNKYWQIIESWQPLIGGITVLFISLVVIFLLVYLLFRRAIFKRLFNVKLENYDAVSSKFLSDLFLILKNYVNCRRYYSSSVGLSTLFKK
jgi:uncharacterized protein YacL